jgi:hypothetical protein
MCKLKNQRWQAKQQTFCVLFSFGILLYSYVFICTCIYLLLSNKMEYNISKHYGIHLSVENFLEYTNKSQPSVDDTLEYFNEVETRRRIVPLVYLALLVILGVPG